MVHARKRPDMKCKQPGIRNLAAKKGALIGAVHVRRMLQVGDEAGDQGHSNQHDDNPAAIGLQPRDAETAAEGHHETYRKDDQERLGRAIQSEPDRRPPGGDQPCPRIGIVEMARHRDIQAADPRRHGDGEQHETERQDEIDMVRLGRRCPGLGDHAEAPVRAGSETIGRRLSCFRQRSMA